MNEYNIQDNPEWDDETLNVINNVNKLSEPDKIILYLYAEFQSYRKLSKILNVSFTTVYKTIKEIRNKILNP